MNNNAVQIQKAVYPYFTSRYCILACHDIRPIYHVQTPSLLNANIIPIYLHIRQVSRVKSTYIILKLFFLHACLAAALLKKYLHVYNLNQNLCKSL